MAITKSARKALRQSQKRKKRNVGKKDKIKSLVKEARKLTLAKKIEEVKKLLPQIYKILDKAAKTGLIKKNTASRKKSRLTKMILKAR
jgi:small subunit ribosomal protein S20